MIAGSVLAAAEIAEQCQSPACGTGTEGDTNVTSNISGSRFRAIPGALSRIQFPHREPWGKGRHSTAASGCTALFLFPLLPSCVCGHAPQVILKTGWHGKPLGV